MKQFFGFQFLRAVLLPLFAGLLFVAVSPAVSHAKMLGLPDPTTLKIHIGDPVPLNLDVVKESHDAGKSIVLMFGNIDHCIYCEKDWYRLKDVIDKYRPSGVVAIRRNYRAAKFDVPDEIDVKYAEQFGIVGEPWLFFIDKKGIIKNIMMGIIDGDVLDAGVKKLVEEGK